MARLDDERCAAMPCVVCTAGGCPSRRPIIGRFSPSASARDPPAGAHRLPPQRDPDAALGGRAAGCRRAPAARFEDRQPGRASCRSPRRRRKSLANCRKSRGIRGSCRGARRARRYRGSSCNGAAPAASPGPTTSGCTTSGTASPRARWRSARAFP